MFGHLELRETIFCKSEKMIKKRKVLEIMTAAVLSWDVTPILVLYNRSGLAHNYHLCQFLRLEGAKSSSYRVTGDLIYQKHLEIRYKKDFTTVTNYMISFVAKKKRRRCNF